MPDEDRPDRDKPGSQSSSRREPSRSGKPSAKSRQRRPSASEQPVLPSRATEDDPERWGDRWDGDDDARIRREVPPHHGH